MDVIKKIFQKEFVKKIAVLIFIAAMFYLLKSVIDLILLTFLFTYLIYSFHEFLYKVIGQHLYISDTAATIILYVIIIGLIILVVWGYAPTIINESMQIFSEITNFKIDFGSTSLGKLIAPITQQLDVKSYLKSGTSFIIKFAANIGKSSFNVFIALMLSMIFMFERKTISKFMSKFETSKVSGLYNYLKIFSKSFLNSFGKVIQTQIIIAIVNTGLSIVALSIMGFPEILGLALMIFILSLIPVAGVIISLVPLCIIAYQIGGLAKVVYVIIMIAFLHIIESYVLNPKFMAAKTKLPVFFTFVILIISQHFMGIWGLLLGIPLFMFVLDLLSVNTNGDNPPKVYGIHNS